MIKTARGRVLAVVLILAAQASLFPMYAQQPVNPDANVYAGADEFTQSPEQYIGQQVVSGGFVQSTSPLTIETDTATGAYLITITDSGLSPEVGDKVRVYGTLIGSQRINSIHAFVVPQSGLWYTWGVSFLAGLWVLVRLLRHWALNFSQLSFAPRKRTLAVRNFLSSDRSGQGDDDA